MKQADFWVAVMEASESVQAGEEALAEYRQQYASEVALFGDAWAGAAHDIARVERAVAKAHDRLAALLALA